MRKLMQFHYYAIRMLACIAGFCVAFLIVGIGAEAIMRSLGIGLIKGIIDLSEYSLFLISVLAAPWLLNCNQHIRVDILIGQLRGPLRRYAERLVNVIVLVVSLVIFYYSVQVFLESWRLQEVIYREIEFPDWWVQWQIPLAMGLISLELFQRIFFPRVVYEPVRSQSKGSAEDVVMNISAEGVQ